MSPKLENVLNSGIGHARQAKSEHVSTLVQNKHIAQALEDLFIALALTNGLALLPATERNSYSSVQNPIVSAAPKAPEPPYTERR